MYLIILPGYLYVCVKVFLTKQKHIFSRKEKKDVDDLEEEDTKKLFLEQGTLEEAKQKELQEYLDAKNKEVIYLYIRVRFLFLNVF